MRLLFALSLAAFFTIIFAAPQKLEPVVFDEEGWIKETHSDDPAIEKYSRVRRSNVIPICVKAWTGGCDNWKSLRIARYDDHIYSVRECHDLCSSTKSCAGFFISTNGSPNKSIKPGTCELYRDGCTKTHWNYWDYYTMETCNFVQTCSTTLPTKKSTDDCIPLSLRVKAEFFEKSIKKASKNEILTLSSSSFRSNYDKFGFSLSRSIGFKGFSASAAFAFEKVTASSESFSSTTHREKSNEVEYKPGFLQIERVITTEVTINGKLAKTIERELVDSVKVEQHESPEKLKQRGKNYINDNFGNLAGEEGACLRDNVYTASGCVSQAWLLVSEKRECGGSEIWAGHLATVDECAKSCYGRSSMFAFGTNDYGMERCWEGGCSCYCETAASSEGTCSEGFHSGFRLYKYKTTD